MTAAMQKQIAAKALALPKKARALLLYKLLESLNSNSQKEVLAESRASYGPVADEEAIMSPEKWDKTWKAELKKRLKEMEDGIDPGVPLDDILELLRKPIRRS